MKKWILVFCLFSTIIILSIYLFIPGTQTFTFKTIVNGTENGTSRLMLDKERWHSWWPGKKEGNTIYSYKNYNYRINNVFLNSFEVTVFNKEDSVKGSLQIISTGTDSTQLLWTSIFNYSANPLNRLTQYNRSLGIQSNIQKLLAEVKIYFNNQEHIYGMAVVKQKVTDSSLISVKQTFQHYPSTKEIYGMVQSLKDYIRKKGGEENNYPMLNVYKEGATQYETMVAIPTKKDLSSEGKFHLKKMVLGNILMAEVKGGIHTVLNAKQELTNYVKDYKKVSPAIPYELLVTNRLLESDTTKWVTRLYYPIYQ